MLPPVEAACAAGHNSGLLDRQPMARVSS